jgi:hypothetical protein
MQRKKRLFFEGELGYRSHPAKADKKLPRKCPKNAPYNFPIQFPLPAKRPIRYAALHPRNQTPTKTSAITSREFPGACRFILCAAKTSHRSARWKQHH